MFFTSVLFAILNAVHPVTRPTCSLQAFARLFALFLGLFCLGVLSLASLGWITIEWQVAQQQFQALPGVLATQFSGFHSFLQGALPSIGMAGLGLFAGLIKK